MGYYSDVAFEIRVPQGADTAIFEKIKDAAVKACEDVGIKEAMNSLFQTADIAMDDEIAVMRFLDTWKWCQKEDDAWVTLATEAEALGCSGDFRRIGEDAGDMDVDRFGDDPGLIEYKTVLRPHWGDMGVHVDVYDIRRLAGDPGLSVEAVCRLSKAVRPGVETLITEKARAMGLYQKPKVA